MVAARSVFSAKPVTFDLNERQLKVAHKAFRHFIGELAKAKQLGAAPFIVELVDVLGVELEDGEQG